jgi:glutathione S-transferase
MILFQRHDCPFCWKIRLVLAEAKMECSLESQADAALYSPQATVPVMLDGEFAIWDSSVIAEYIADLSPQAKLMGDEPAARARIRLMHMYSDKIAGLGLRDVIFERRSKSLAEQDQQRIEQGSQQWGKTLDWLEAAYGQGAYMAGDAFSVADCALIPRLSLAEAYGLPLDGVRHPKLADWLERMRKRPTYDASKPSIAGI